MGGRGPDLERADHGLARKKGPKYFLYFRVLRAMILLGIFFGFPEDKTQDTAVLFVRDENHLVHETLLLF